jgi:hypothetical protein
VIVARLNRPVNGDGLGNCRGNQSIAVGLSGFEMCGGSLEELADGEFLGAAGFAGAAVCAVVWGGEICRK